MKFDLLAIDELGKIDRGRSRHRPRDEKSLYGGKYPFIQTGDVKRSPFYINSYSQTYSEKGLAQSKLWKRGTLCITIAANIADTAILNIDACFPDSILGFIPYKDKSNAKFIKYCFDVYKTTLEAISKGTTQDNLSLDKLRKIKFKIPPLPIQRKIAVILSAYDDLIENNNRRINILEKMAEELYREWFVRLRFPGHEKVKIVKGVPEGWEVKKSLALFNVLGGGTPKTDIPNYWNGDIPFFTPKDAHAGYFADETEKHITQLGLESCNSKLYPKDTIFITARGTVGKIVLALHPMAMNQSCYALEPKQGDHIYYYFLSMRNAVDIIKGTSNSGVFDNIITDSFKQFDLFKPDDKIFNNFSEIASPIFQKIEGAVRANSLFTSSRDRLLTRLMSGKIDVAQLDIQFPPSMKDAEAMADA